MTGGGGSAFSLLVSKRAEMTDLCCRMILTIGAATHYTPWTGTMGVMSDPGTPKDPGKGPSRSHLLLIIRSQSFLGTFVRNMFEAYWRNPSISDLRTLIGRFTTVQVRFAVVFEDTESG